MGKLHKVIINKLKLPPFFLEKAGGAGWADEALGNGGPQYCSEPLKKAVRLLRQVEQVEEGQTEGE